MNKTAFIFPGQGAQKCGMGKDFYETFPCAKEMIDLAEKVSGIPMKELLFEENENINITKPVDFDIGEVFAGKYGK